MSSKISSGTAAEEEDIGYVGRCVDLIFPVVCMEVADLILAG